MSRRDPDETPASDDDDRIVERLAAGEPPAPDEEPVVRILGAWRHEVNEP